MGQARWSRHSPLSEAKKDYRIARVCGLVIDTRDGIFIRDGWPEVGGTVCHRWPCRDPHGPIGWDYEEQPDRGPAALEPGSTQSTPPVVDD